MITTATLADYKRLLQQENLLTATAEIDTEAWSQPVDLVCYDSQKVAKNTLFVVKGAHFKGVYLTQAIANGAIAYVAEQPLPEGADICFIRVNHIRRTMGVLAGYYYQNPSSRIDVIGITGTKGKTSATYYLKTILDVYLATKTGRESGVISSIDTYDGVERFESHLTTPEPLDLQAHLAHGADSGLDYMTMEVSSQALKYNRMDGVKLAAAVFLNIGYDHVSPLEHADFEDYFQSKLQIFQHSDLAVVNLDCDQAQRVVQAAKQSARQITFSQKNKEATVFARDVRKVGGAICFHVKTPRYAREFLLTMPGFFNVENALAAIAVCEGLDIPVESIAKGLKSARVPGRMEIYQKKNVTAIVDYAHNRMSFETLFASTKAEYPNEKIMIVYGCPGKKAYDRRKDLAEIAVKYADHIIITEEDPGEEDVVAISEEIKAHTKAFGGDCVLELNRGKAIGMAIQNVTEPTVILITGKGRETNQKRGTQYIDCVSDVEYVQEYLKQL